MCVSVTGSMLASLKISVSNVQIVMSASESAASLVLSFSFVTYAYAFFLFPEISIEVFISHTSASSIA